MSLSRSNEEFEELYQRNKDTVYQLCCLYLKSRADAEDAMQSVFLKLIDSGKIFNDSSHERAWLITASKNHCLNALKSWWKSRRVSFDTLPEIPSWDDRDVSKEILAKLFNLPAKYKDVLYLYYYEGYSVKELAAMLDQKESTIRTRLERGRKRLKIDLGGLYHD